MKIKNITEKIDITNLNKDTVEKIDELAKLKGLKRSEFLEKYITSIALQDELFNVFNRYETLLKKVECHLELNVNVLDKITNL